MYIRYLFMYVCCVNFPLSNVYLLIKEKKRKKKIKKRKKKREKNVIYE